MKKIKSVVTLTFMLFVCLSVQAQWAGPDPVVVRKPDNSQKAVIGPADDTQDASYHWEGPHIFSQNHNNPQIVINPQNDGEVYTVTRVTACGEEQDEVVVRLKECATLESVIPKKQCYSHGDPINVWDFDIVTSPPGHYENLVSVTPNHASNNLEFLGTGDVQQLTFTLNHQNCSTSATAMVEVYNDDVSATVNANYAHYHKLLKQVERIKDVIAAGKDINKIISKIKAIADPFATAIQITPIFNVNGTLPPGVGVLPGSNVRFFKSCCNDNVFDGFALQLAGFSAEIGTEVDFPMIAFVGIGGLYLHGGILVGASVGPFDFKYIGDCSNANIPVAFYVEAEGGIKAMLLNDDFFNATLALVGRAQISFNWKVGEEFVFHPLDFNCSIKGKVTTLGFFSFNVNYPLGSISVFNN